MVSLDIVIPVYNEGPNIRAVLDSLQAAVRTPCRVLICYDRDDDDTLTALDGYSCWFEIVRVRNRATGPHAAIMTGFVRSTAPAVLVFPADDTFNAHIIDSMYGLAAGGCDLVAASRFIKGGSMVGCPWLKAMLVRVSSFTLHHLARIPIHDASSGFRLFSRRCLASIVIESSSGFTYSIELLVKCHRLRWKMNEVPAAWIERSAGKSRFRVLRWLPAYLKWYGYAFGTTYLRKGPGTVPMRRGS